MPAFDNFVSLVDRLLWLTYSHEDKIKDVKLVDEELLIFLEPKEYEDEYEKILKSIVIRNGKILWKHGPYCWYFRLNLKHQG